MGLNSSAVTNGSIVIYLRLYLHACNCLSLLCMSGIGAAFVQLTDPLHSQDLH